jgi:hypothetical protein
VGDRHRTLGAVPGHGEVPAEVGEEGGLGEQQAGPGGVARSLDVRHLVVGGGPSSRDLAKKQQVHHRHVGQPGACLRWHRVTRGPQVVHQRFQLGPPAGEEQVVDRQPGELVDPLVQRWVPARQVERGAGEGSPAADVAPGRLAGHQERL